MSLEVYIENQLIDLPPEAVVALSYQLNNIADLVSRQANFTNRIKAPFSKNNDKVFKFARNFSSGSSVPYQKLATKIVQNGIEVVPIGETILDSADEEYIFTVYSGIFNPFILLEAINVQDLDLSEFDYIWDVASAAAIANETEGAVYAAAQFGTLVDTNNRIDIRLNHHSVYFHSVMTAAFDRIGFNLVGNIFFDSRYLGLTIPAGAKPFKHTTIEATSSLETDYIITGAGTKVVFDNTDFNVFSEWNGTDTYESDGIREMAFRIKLSFTDLTGEVLVRVTGIPSNVQEILVVPNNGIAEVNFLTDETEYILTEKVSVELFSISPFESATIKAGGRIVNIITSPIFEADTKILINENLPDMDCKEFLKNQLQIFAITNDTNLFQKDMIFTQFGEIVKNTAQALDWTDKLDLQQSTKKTFSFGSYAKKNIASWDNDDEVPKSLGQGFFLIDDETLKETKEVFEMSFSASKSGTFLEGVNMAVIDAYIGFLREFDSNDRITLTKDLSKTIVYTDGTTDIPVNDLKVLYFKDPDQDFSLGFEDNVLSENYSEFIQMLQRFQGMKPRFKLTASDINELRLTIPIFLRQENAYFIRNLIDKFTAGESTAVELIRING